MTLIRLRHPRPVAPSRLPLLRLFFCALLGSVVCLNDRAEAAPAVEPLALRAGDHLAIVGNALADRMQHSGYFETLLHAQSREHRRCCATWRSRGMRWSCDIGRRISVRPTTGWGRSRRMSCSRSLVSTIPSGRGGARSFRAELRQFLEATRASDYSGRGAPRIALVSPIGGSDIRIRTMRIREAINVQLNAIPPSWRRRRREQGVLFVDLFQPSLELYAEAAGRRTFPHGQRLPPDRGGRPSAGADPVPRDPRGEPAPGGPGEAAGGRQRQELAVASALPDDGWLQRVSAVGRRWRIIRAREGSSATGRRPPLFRTTG